MPSRTSSWPPSQSTFVVFVVLCGIACAGLFGRSTSIWDGGFPDTEIELTFLDSDGQPLSGIQLQVVREDGRNSLHRPINDYYANRTPTSDGNGVLTFHCVDIRFGGTCNTYFYIFESGGCSGPQYLCRFFRNGDEVHQIRFDELIFTDEKSRESRTIKIPTEEQIGELWMNGQINDPFEESNLVESERELFVVKRSVILNSE